MNPGVSKDLKIMFTKVVFVPLLTNQLHVQIKTMNSFWNISFCEADRLNPWSKVWRS